MIEQVRQLDALLRGLRPVLNPGVVAFCVLPPDMPAASVSTIGIFREPEGVTVIVDEPEATRLGLSPVFRAAWITLNVHSPMDAVGLTAAVARALANAGISCNVVAAAHHDHLFVPADKGVAAVETLARLQASAIE